MRTIGIRELRQAASEHLRAVAAGESLTITDRGVPVALLVPVPPEEQRLAEVLRRHPHLAPPTGVRRRFAAAPNPRVTAGLSEAVERDRDDRDVLSHPTSR